MANCTKCGTVLAANTIFCGSCGAPVAAAPAAPGAAVPASAPSIGLTSNVAGMLAYFTFIPAILFLVIEPYNKDRYVRFHAFQSLFFNIAWIAVWMAMIFLGFVLGLVPVVGLLIHLLLDLVIGFGGFILWIVLVIKAYGNQEFQLPVIGKIAKEQAAK
jgi:uncharacterized membrane protein